MPPSRGLWSAGHIINGMSRSSMLARIGGTSARSLSSASLAARTARANTSRRRIAGASASLPVTSYLVNHGKADLSLWPFSSSGSNATNGEKDFAALHRTREGTSDKIVEEATKASVEPVTVEATAPPSPAAQSHNPLVQDTATTTPASVPSAPPLEPPTPIAESLPTEPISPDLFDPRTDPASATDLTYIGQMRDLGLDFGWGPTSCMQWLTEHIHVYSGMPWYGTILSVAILMRIVLAPLMLRNLKLGARLRICTPRLNELRKRFSEQNKNGEKLEAAKTAKEMGRLSKTMGANPVSMLATPIIQGVAGFAGFRLFRNMADLPVPGMTEGGFLWLWNLTVPDPLYVLPVLQAVFMYFQARLNMRLNPPRTDQMAVIQGPLMHYALPFTMFAVSAFLPGAVQLTFLTATIWGVFQLALFHSPLFKTRLDVDAKLMEERLAASTIDVTATSTSAAGRALPASGPPIPGSSLPSSASSDRALPRNHVDLSNAGFSTNPFANLKTVPKKGAQNPFAVQYEAPRAADVVQQGIREKERKEQERKQKPMGFREAGQTLVKSGEKIMGVKK